LLQYRWLFLYEGVALLKNAAYVKDA
jgi:hypothetical protein